MSVQSVALSDPELDRLEALTIANGRQHTAETILHAWYESKGNHTRRSYGHDLEDFALFFSRALGVEPRLTIIQALDGLFQQSAPSAHEIVLAFRDHLVRSRLSPASINRHIACLRSVTKLGRMLGAMSWYIEIGGVKAERRRPTAGPTLEDVNRLLAATSGASAAETRDYAIVLTFIACGLRVSELCGLNLEDCDLARGTTWIQGKGRRERELIPLPSSVVEAIRRYLSAAGRSIAPAARERGPLFQSRGTRGRSGSRRLDTRSVLRIVRTLGQKVGLRLWPHALRHTAITQAAELGQRAGLGLDKIRAFSRHRTIATLMTYVDERDREQTQRALGEMVAGSLTTRQ
jgi:integrase